MSIPKKDYDNLKSAIETANKIADKEALKKIKLLIVSKYGIDDRDSHYLLNLFRYTV